VIIRSGLSGLGVRCGSRFTPRSPRTRSACARIFDFEFLIGRGDWLTRNSDKNAVHGRGDKRDHD